MYKGLDDSDSDGDDLFQVFKRCKADVDESRSPSSTVGNNANAVEERNIDDAEVVEVDIDDSGTKPANPIPMDVPGVIKLLQSKIDDSGQFFLAARRNAPLSRILSIWKRESSKNSPEKTLRLRFLGEDGINSGAMARELLSL